MSPPRRTDEELRDTYLTAYELWRDGGSLREIAAAMRGAPHFCGGHSTARVWIAKGRALAIDKTDGNLKRAARRETAAEAVRRIRVELAEDVRAGRLDREAFYKLRLHAINTEIRLLGLAAAPEPSTSKVKVSGGAKSPAMPPELAAFLAKLDPEELTFPPDDEGDEHP